MNQNFHFNDNVYTVLLSRNSPVKSFRIEVNCRNDFIPTFHNLTQLELDSLDYNWQFLLQVLNHCPKLQKLEIYEADTYEVTWTRKDDRENWVDPDFVPQCISLHLRTCNLYAFLGLQGELQLARYILKNAKVLQNMIIWNLGQPEIYSLLSSCPTASPTCKLTFHDSRETTEDDDDDDSDDDDSDDDML
ncbi:hypothetical protein QL285_036711 [Trifolium repens]|nr:hypothetical protein QL285_036711 [Trifolium repens]